MFCGRKSNRERVRGSKIEGVGWVMLTRIHPERIAAASHVPTAGCDLTQLTNDELIAGTRLLVGSSNQLFAMLLAHLAEVETRGIHRERA